MRIWERTRLVEHCGNCNRRLTVGTPIQVITLPDVGPDGRRRIRCEDCAGVPVNEEQLEAFDVQEDGRAATKTLPIRAPHDFAGATRNLFDAKMAQTGERE